MRKIRNAIVGLVVVGALFGSGVAYGSANRVPVAARRAHYALQSDLFGYPYTLRLRHCAPAEDTLGKLIMVDYRPSDGVVVYRCHRNY